MIHISFYMPLGHLTALAQVMTAVELLHNGASEAGLGAALKATVSKADAKALADMLCKMKVDVDLQLKEEAEPETPIDIPIIVGRKLIN